MINRQLAIWNSLVSPKWRFLREEPTYYVFLHPTKGYRYLHKRRVGA